MTIPDDYIKVFQAAVPLMQLLYTTTGEWRDDVAADADMTDPFDPDLIAELDILRSLLIGVMDRAAGLLDADSREPVEVR